MLLTAASSEALLVTVEISISTVTTNISQMNIKMQINISTEDNTPWNIRYKTTSVIPLPIVII